MKHIFLLFLLFNFKKSIAQISSDTIDKGYTYDSNKPNYSLIKPEILLLKLKFAPLPMGNSLYLITSLGGNIRFLKHHSLGLSYYRSYLGFQEEEAIDTTGLKVYSTNIGFKKHKNTTGSYRYYLNPDNFDDEGCIWYIGTFYRYGEIVESYDPLFTKTPSYTKEKNFSKGVLFGLLYKFEDYFGYDVNIGVYQRNSSIMHSTTHYNNTSYTSENKTSWGIRLDFGITFML
jgi:hypothetical protein